MTEDLKTSECRSCGAIIIWATTVPKGKNCPMDSSPSEAGSFDLRKGRNTEKVYAKHIHRDDRQGRLLYESHFSTCPNAKEHRNG